MRIYFLSPSGVPENPCLFPTMRPTFINQGVEIVDRISDADVVFLDLHSRLSDYNEGDVDWILYTDTPIVSFCEWDRGNLSSDEYPEPLTSQQREIFGHIKDCDIKSVHFCRLLNKNTIYPSNVFPYEKPISHEWPILTPEELFNRPYEISWVANSSPSRQAIADAFIKDGRFRCNISLGQPQIPFDEWVNEHRKAKLFISAGAGGYTDQKVQALFSVAGIIRERSDQLLLHDFTHLQDCLRIDSPPTKRDLDTVYDIVNDKEMLYSIYLTGYSFMKKYYTEEYIASYILETVKKHLA